MHLSVVPSWQRYIYLFYKQHRDFLKKILENNVYTSRFRQLEALKQFILTKLAWNICSWPNQKPSLAIVTSRVSNNHLLSFNLGDLSRKPLDRQFHCVFRSNVFEVCGKSTEEPKNFIFSKTALNHGLPLDIVQFAEKTCQHCFFEAF